MTVESLTLPRPDTPAGLNELLHGGPGAGGTGAVLHRLPPRQLLAGAAALVALVLVTRVPLASRYLFNWDAGNFALAFD